MELTPAFIASLIGGKVEGDPDVKISGFAKIEEAKPGDITFLANKKYTHCIYTTKAGAVLVRDDFQPEEPVSAVLIRVPDPYIALAELLNKLSHTDTTPVGVEQPAMVAEGVEVPEDCYIGAFSYLSKGVRLGKGVKIYPQVFVGENVEIGEGTVIRPGVKIYAGCKIGANCTLHAGCVIGADGFGFAPLPDGSYEKIPQIGNVLIEDDVEIGANTTVDRATFGSTRIGRGTKLDNLIQIAHNVELGRCNVIASQAGIAGSTKIGNYNQIGGQVGIAGHLYIGSFNQIGAQSGVHSSFGDHERMMGYPAVKAGEFARTTVYLKRLGDLFKSKN